VFLLHIEPFPIWEMLATLYTITSLLFHPVLSGILIFLLNRKSIGLQIRIEGANKKDENINLNMHNV
jgi:hypothetical protein